MLIRIGNLIAKQLHQYRRDRLLAAFLVLAPALQLILMARSIERGINPPAVAILDQDRSPLSRQLIARLENTHDLRVRFYADTMEEVRLLLDGGKARLAVVIPAGFAQEVGLARAAGIRQGQGPAIQLIADGTKPLAASTTVGTAADAVAQFTADLAASYGFKAADLIDLRTDILFNSGLDVRDYTIPAQVGFITYQITLAVAALSLARERELGTLEQLMVTPLRRFELAIGKGIPAMAVGALNFVAMWVISLTVFHVPMNGSPVLLAGLSLLFISAVASWGLVISAFSRTQQQAILFVFVQAMVDMTFSGFLVRVKDMPAFLQALSRVVPLQYYLTIVRSIMIKGAGFEDLKTPVLALAALAAVMGVAALASVARRVE